MVKIEERKYKSVVTLDRAVNSKHKGQWIVRDGSYLVASGDTLMELVVEAKKRNIKKPVVRKVPTAKIDFCFF